MSEQDYKYLLLSYQQKSFDLFTQNIALDSKVKQLSELVESLTNKVNQLESQKSKRTTKSETEDFK
jgi:archaellum component FlaC